MMIRMKQRISLLLVAAICAAVLSGCEGKQEPSASTPPPAETEGAIFIELTDEGITVDGAEISTEETAAVYAANDIIYYEEGRDFTYGEGMEEDAHRAEEAADHAVIHITRPGAYAISGTLSAGQIAVDLGEDAKEDPKAVVTLILNGVDITCSVAPAVIFYHVYECGSTDTETATKDVDTTAAGANVIIADDTMNYVNGSYVARIYKPDSVELSEDGTEVLDAKKLHKYDAAFYSKMSMNINGGEKNSGILKIKAENEGLDSELHLTINGGMIVIESGNDGINTNEDGVSVTTINGGEVVIQVTGETGEGDGIDSNGWLVINGGKVIASAGANSAESGIDSDMGIHINGGIIMASGHMLDRIESGGQNFVVFRFVQMQSGEEVLSLRNADGEELMAYAPMNDCSNILFSSPELTAGEYTLWSNETQLLCAFGGAGGMMDFPGGMGGGFRPNGAEAPQMPEGMKPPVGFEMPEGMTPPEGMKPPEGFELPEGMEFSLEGMGWPVDMMRPEGQGDGVGKGSGNNIESSEVFTITDGGCYITVT